MAGDIEAIRCSIGVGVTPDRAFEIFVEDFGRWWPIAYTYGDDQFENAGIEARVGGNWFETKLDGSRQDWGEVRAFARGRSLIISFNVSAERKPEPPGRESEVAIRFLPASGGTRLELEHRDFEKHGAGAATLRQAMASPQGWPLILASYAREARYAA